MLYITKNLRERYNNDVEALTNGTVVIKDLADRLHREDLKNQDGIMNYILTVALHKKPDMSISLIEELLLVFYEDPKCYMMYQRLIGLLVSMINEHVRRGWYLPIRFVELEHKIYRERIAPYEDQKIVENGDI